ncbi:uncharacterized protein ACIBXB_002032 isoform 1-T1 [Morphnus guianensis]
MRHRGLGWIRAGGRSLAALRGLRHPQAQPTPAPPLPAHPRGRGPSSLSPSLPSLGAPSRPAGSGLSPCPLLRDPQLPSRHGVPSTWRGALAQPAARGDRRPQLGSCSLPGRRGQAPAAVGPNGCSVSRDIPWLHPGGVPKEPGQCPDCPANGSGRAAGGLGLKPAPVPGFLGPLRHSGHSAVPLLSLLHLPGIQGSGAAPGCHGRRWMRSWGPRRGQVLAQREPCSRRAGKTHQERPRRCLLERRQGSDGQPCCCFGRQDSKAPPPRPLPPPRGWQPLLGLRCSPPGDVKAAFFSPQLLHAAGGGCLLGVGNQISCTAAGGAVRLAPRRAGRGRGGEPPPARCRGSRAEAPSFGRAALAGFPGARA